MCYFSKVGMVRNGNSSDCGRLILLEGLNLVGIDGILVGCRFDWI